MDQLSSLLAEATAAITPPYFHLPIDGGDPVYRERVYCYELYHQLRLRWPNDAPFNLNGEVDKAAHPILSKLGANYTKPDFLVHGPGRMSHNHAIIEVKSVNARPVGIQKDLETLFLFRTRVGYERAIYLIYGHERLDRLLTVIKGLAEKLNVAAPIEVWVHDGPGRPAVHVIDLGYPAAT